MTVSMDNGKMVVKGAAKPSEWVTFFRGVTFRNSKSATDTRRSITFMLGDVTASKDGHFYGFVTSPAGSEDGFVSWYDADKAASYMKFNGMQGYLATILSSEENEILTNELKGNGWLGGSDDYKQINAAIGSTKYNNQSESEGEWFWVRGPEQGTPFFKATYNGDPNGQIASKYSNWNQSEPNNNWAQKTKMDTTNPENFLEIYGAGGAYGSKGTWNDWNALKHYSGQDFIKGFVVEFGGMNGDPTTNIFPEGTVNIAKSFITPVKLKSFSGLAKNKSVVLLWSTVSEYNSKSFEILRSVNGGGSWEKLSSVPAIGNSSAFHEYTFTDENLGKYNLYKLNQIDRDGVNEYSNTISVNVSEAMSESISLFPNPAKESITIKNVEVGSTVGIYNMAGVLLRSLTATNKTFTVQLGHFQVECML
ncbi:MAG: hypothetical protein DI598_13635 [Pseudopedobacter saltans]|uniref:C-type lectin domain-containing protein n=1 Tax=Pseudopedobacter saltans TaxID=151895 RepID=A0A2W5EUG9_9SPHI|nr:MAG: hypothetical protein DI598_13635 [Pseudopedobacter saltans]